MSRSLGWQAKSLVDGGGALMEVYETKPSGDADPVSELLDASTPAE